VIAKFAGVIAAQLWQAAGDITPEMVAETSSAWFCFKIRTSSRHLHSLGFVLSRRYRLRQ